MASPGQSWQSFCHGELGQEREQGRGCGGTGEIVVPEKHLGTSPGGGPEAAGEVIPIVSVSSWGGAAGEQAAGL